MINCLFIVCIRALECDLISQGCDKKKSEGAPVRPAVREKKEK